MRIVLLGAGGFLGRYLLSALVADGHHCVVLTRAAVRHGDIGLLPGTEVVQSDVHDAGVLTKCFAGADAVVSMVGILNETGAGQGFHKVHVRLVETMIDACKAARVARVLHVSALRAGEGRSQYLKTKGEAEQLLRKAGTLNVTVFQPSVIFGRGDGFFNRFAMLLQLLWVMPLTCPKARLQPVYAADVATAMAASLDDPMTWGKRFALAGPQSYTLKELVQWTANCMGLNRYVLGLPAPVSAAMAVLMGLVPGKPFSMDNYRSLQIASTTETNGFAYFGIAPRSIETVVPDYLVGSVHQRRLQALRSKPRRNG